MTIQIMTGDVNVIAGSGGGVVISIPSGNMEWSGPLEINSIMFDNE
jgi:hypothetical protein